MFSEGQRGGGSPFPPLNQDDSGENQPKRSADPEIEEAGGLEHQPPPLRPKPPLLVLTGCKVSLVMYCTERVN